MQMIEATRRDPLWKTDPSGDLLFVPNGGQLIFIESPAQEILFSGHWGNGKSIALVMKCLMLCERYPGIRGVLLRKTYADLRISTLRHLRRVLGDAAWFAGVVGGERPERFDFANGSSIDFIGVMGESGRSDKLLSTEYGFIGADEANELEEADWEMAMGRLRQPGIPIHQIFGCTNPDNPQHWLYGRFKPDAGTNRQWRDDACPTCRGAGECVQQVLNEDTGEVAPELWTCWRCEGSRIAPSLIRECVVAGMNENDENQPPAYLAFKRSLKGVRRARFFEGKWVAFEGQIFTDWDANTHLCDPPTEWARWRNLPPPDWRRVVGIDLGFENPFVAEWFAISPEEHWYRYREIYMSHRTVDDHARQVLEYEAAELATLRACAAEPGRETDAKQYADYLEALYVIERPCDHDRGEREIMQKEGLWTTAANKELQPGLQTMILMLDPSALGGTHLHLLRNVTIEVDQRLEDMRAPTSLEQEIPLYRWAKRSSGELAGVARDLPLDKHNHGIDAARYALHTLAARGRVAVY